MVNPVVVRLLVAIMRSFVSLKSSSMWTPAAATNWDFFSLEICQVSDFCLKKLNTNTNRAHSLFIFCKNGKHKHRSGFTYTVYQDVRYAFLKTDKKTRRAEPTRRRDVSLAVSCSKNSIFLVWLLYGNNQQQNIELKISTETSSIPTVR